MTEKKPTAIHGIEIVGPSENLNELKLEVNDKLEQYAKAWIEGMQLCETNRGFVILFWYKIV